MRKIKFKVNCKKHKREEIYTLGDLIMGRATAKNGEGGIFENWRSYTGLHDKNGKEIYENMIINNEYIVVYDFCKFVLKNIKNGNITDFKRDGVYEITREYFE